MAVQPIALRASATPAQLLAGWRGQGWSVQRSQFLRQVPVGIDSGKPTIPLQVDAFEWEDVSLFGVGNTDDVVGRIRTLIQQGGSDLYAYALFKHVDVDFLGIKAVRYRIVFVHSIVQLAIAAVAILAIGFAAVIFLQYFTTGQAPAVADLKNLWAGIVKPVADGVGNTVQGVANVYIWATVAAGAVAIAFGIASKQTGANVRQPKGPGGSIGVRAGPLTAKASS